MRLPLALVCWVLSLPAVTQGVFSDNEEKETLVAPRLCLPRADLVGKNTVCASYAFRGANHEGRDLESSQYAVTVGVTERIELAWDYHSIDVEGRTRGNTFDVDARGWGVRYGQELFGAPGALFVGYRTAGGRVVTGGNTRIPPDANAVTFGAVRSQSWLKESRLHLTASFTRSEVGGEESWTLMGGAGVDYPVTKRLIASGDVALFKDTGDVSGFEAAIAGGLRYETGSGLSVDVSGTLMPSGTPLAGGPLADGSVFVLDPVFRTEPIVRDLRNDTLGYYTIRIAYTKKF